MNSRDQYGADLAAGLHDYEALLDRTIAAGAGLAVLMTTGRLEHNISAVVGQSALAKVLSSTQTLASAREDLVGAHKGLAADARRLSITWSPDMSGPMDKPEEDRPRPTGELRSVA